MADNMVKLEPIGNSKGPTNRTNQNEDNEYDPHLHREIENPTTNTETLVHLLKGCLGTGILAMPEAFKLSGMAVGIVSTIIIGFLCTYCLHVLVKAQYVMCKRMRVPLLTYPESMRTACEMGPTCLRRFGPYAPAITNFFLIFYQLGICCVYIVFVGQNMQKVANYYLGPEKEISLTLFILIFFVPFFLIICIRNLKLLAPFSVLANVITFVTFGVVGYYVCQDLPNFGDLPQTGRLFDYPLYFGTTLFSLQAVGVVIALENNMSTPKNFRQPTGVLNVGMGLVTFIYVLMAVMGYWRYGENIQSSITLNFPAGEPLAHAIMVLYSIAIYISYGLQGYVPVQIIWTNYIEMRLTSKKLFYEYLLRLGCVILTFALAITVPLLGLFISLVGAFCLSALGIAFPAIIEMCAYWPDRLGPGRWIFWKDILLIIVGIIGLLAGSYSCIFEIVRQLTITK